MGSLFRLGQHVACIDDADKYAIRRRLFGFIATVSPYASGRIVRGTVYTVASLDQGFNTLTGDPLVGLRLVEADGFFAARNFRPLSAKRLDVFRDHRAPVRTVEPA